MPKLSWTQTISAGATFEPLNGWQYEYAPAMGGINILHQCDLVGLVCTITAGSDTLQERSPVSAGGTAGVVPSYLDTPPLEELVSGGDRLKILYANTAGGNIIVTGQIDYSPV